MALIIGGIYPLPLLLSEIQSMPLLVIILVESTPSPSTVTHVVKTVVGRSEMLIQARSINLMAFNSEPASRESDRLRHGGPSPKPKDGTSPKGKRKGSSTLSPWASCGSSVVRK